MKKKATDYIKKVLALLKRKETTILPANLAYYFLLSIIPILALTLYVIESFHGSSDLLLQAVELIFSDDAIDIINKTFIGSSYGNMLFILVFSVVIASNGAEAIIIASNSVFNIETKSILKRKLKSIIITFLLILLFAFVLFVPLLGKTIISAFEDSGIRHALLTALKTIYPILKIPFSFIVIFIMIKLIYTVAPEAKVPSTYVNKGSLFTSVFWILITVIYSYYISHFALNSYSIYYGGLSNIIILLFYFYLLAYVFVIGLVMNYKNMNQEIEKTNIIKFEEIKEKMKE